MTRLRSLVLAATILASPVIATAQPIQGLYLGAGAGGNYLQQERVLASPGLREPARTFATDAGGVGVGSVGWGFGNGLRLEIEGNIRHNRVREISNSVVFRNAANGTTSTTTASGGDQFAYGGMVNALFDMDVGYNWIYPYFGLGGGLVDTNLVGVHTYGTGGNSYRENITGWSTNFGYQGIFGLSFPLAAIPGLSLTAEYRFMGVLDSPAFHGSNNLGNAFAAAAQTPASSPHSAGNFNLNSDYNHSLLLGVRYAFDTAPPAPPPEPTPQAPVITPARTYLVFFDWDRADLSARARQIVAEAAAASTRVQTTRIEVQGNADRSGTPDYNQKLSLRRAQTVAAELVRDGVALSAIAIQAFGDTRPLVATAPGVREPQNRRVEIILR